MCGLFGAIAPKWDPSVIRTLAICNRERGTDSLGFFDSTGRMIKSAKDPMEVLGQENITNWISRSNLGFDKYEPSWFIAGHTRLGTRGAANRKNSHPFRYGTVIGSHNGIVQAPETYTVDSMLLFDALNKENGDYQKAWENISGYWGLTRYDGEGFYLQLHNGTLNLVQVDDIWYYSSDEEHLIASVGCNDGIYPLKEGETWRFTCVDGVVVPEEMAKFTNKAVIYKKYVTDYSEYDSDWPETTYGGPQKGQKYEYYSQDTNGKPSTSEDIVHDWEEEWIAAWDEYCTGSEHLVGP